jgi:hypothetical protein
MDVGSCRADPALEDARRRGRVTKCNQRRVQPLRRCFPTGFGRRCNGEVLFAKAGSFGLGTMERLWPNHAALRHLIDGLTSGYPHQQDYAFLT